MQEFVAQSDAGTQLTRAHVEITPTPEAVSDSWQEGVHRYWKSYMQELSNPSCVEGLGQT